MPTRTTNYVPRHAATAPTEADTFISELVADSWEWLSDCGFVTDDADSYSNAQILRAVSELCEGGLAGFIRNR